MASAVAINRQPVIGDAQSEFIATLERFHIAFAGLNEAVKGGKDAHGRSLVETPDVRFGRLSPNDSRHRGLLQRSISSCVIPSSARTCS